MTALREALDEHRAATERLAAVCADATDDLGGGPTQVVEALELLRYQMHRNIDDLIDAEQVRRPPGGNAWRARRYREITVPTAP